MEQVALVVITDGRMECLEQAIASLDTHIGLGRFGQKIMVNDSDHVEYQNFLNRNYKQFQRIHHRERRGLYQTVADGWAAVDSEINFLFHLEDDFIFNEDIDLDDMIEIMRAYPDLVQMLLKRQPWSGPEIAAGGYIELNPDAYQECIDPMTIGHWVEHRQFFSLNPSLIPRRIFELGWHEDNESGFANMIFQSEYNTAGIYGSKFDVPKVHHIGTYRAHGGDYGGDLR